LNRNDEQRCWRPIPIGSNSGAPKEEKVITSIGVFQAGVGVGGHCRCGGIHRVAAGVLLIHIKYAYLHTYNAYNTHICIRIRIHIICIIHVFVYVTFINKRMVLC
jgi:hypothetical protein